MNKDIKLTFVLRDVFLSKILILRVEVYRGIEVDFYTAEGKFFLVRNVNQTS